MKMWLWIAAICLGAALVVSTLLSGTIQRASLGRGEGDQASTELRQIKMGDQRFAIPKGYFDGPPSVVAHDDAYDVVNGVLLEGLAPSFTPRNSQNSAAFDQVGCCIRVLISQVTILKPEEVIPKMHERWMKKFEIVGESSGGGYTHYEVKSLHRDLIRNLYGDIYVRADDQEITECNRLDPERQIVRVNCHIFSAGPAGSSKSLCRATMPPSDQEFCRMSGPLLTVGKGKNIGWQVAVDTGSFGKPLLARLDVPPSRVGQSPK